MLRSSRLLLFIWQATIRLSHHLVSASLCLGGSDIFTSVLENSPPGHLVSRISIGADPPAATARLCLTGRDADWFYLEGRTIRLNSSSSRVLDREVQGAVLIAELTCYEDDVVQSHYQVLVEVLNRNDNRPAFLQDTVQPATISELTAVDSVVLTVKAVDADGDALAYTIDPSSRDAGYFRIDLPNSGEVVLDKPLDYETTTQLQLVMWAQEANTEERFNTSAALRLNVEDGDDHYPHFLPCTPVTPGLPVCMNPTYTSNITQQQQDVVLDFSPGPIRAQDGDRGIDSPLIYSILSGDDGGRFVMNNRSGEVTLTRGVDGRRLTQNFTLSIMVCQVNDRLKYSVTSVLVRVLNRNAFPPTFNRTTFRGFLIHSSSPASIVSTYGNQVLQVQVTDRDFPDGHNPNIHYSLHPSSGLYQVTRDGVLIARTDHLRAFDRHVLQVTARDEESGEEVTASVDLEVLQRGQAVPRGAFTEQPLFGHVDTRLAGGLALMFLAMFLAAVLFLLLQTLWRRRHRDPEGTTARGKPSSVRVLWSQRVNSSPPAFLDPSSYDPALARHSDSLQGRQGVYTRRLSLPHRPPPPPSSGDIRPRPLLPVSSLPNISEPTDTGLVARLYAYGNPPV